jgi:hypothetical protein
MEAPGVGQSRWRVMKSRSNIISRRRRRPPSRWMTEGTCVAAEIAAYGRGQPSARRECLIFCPAIPDIGPAVFAVGDALTSLTHWRAALSAPPQLPTYGEQALELLTDA